MNKYFNGKFPHNKLFLLLYLMISLFIFLFVFQVVYNRHDPDTFWHMALGNWMLKHESVVRTSVNSFNADLDYVPHEVLFQIIISFIFSIFGWMGLHSLSVLCLGILFWGLYKLCFTSMEEFNIKTFHPLMHLIILFIAVSIYRLYMPLRPQMISGPIILWFFIWILKFRKEPTIIKGFILGLLSLAISNFHGGVWPLLLIFYGIAIVELIIHRRQDYKTYSLTLLLILLGGVLNAGGWQTISYIFLLLEDPLAKTVNTEWQSVNFFDAKIFLIFFILIIYGLIRLKTKNIFTILVAIVITVFTVLSYKHAFYGLLFILYILPDGGVIMKNSVFNLKNKQVYGVIGLSLLLFLLSGFFKQYEEPVSMYPVKEMDFILKDNDNNKKIKVLTDFTASAYAHFRGASILADGRWDPFISKKAMEGEYHLNPIERSMYIFESNKNIHLLEEEISISKPGYLIFKNDKSDPFMKTIINDIKLFLGKPEFKGDYGYVWKIQ